MSPVPHIIRTMPGLLAALLLTLLCGLSSAASAGGLELTSLPERADVGRWLLLTSTRDDNLTPGDLLNGGPTPSWQRNMHDGVALGLSGRVWWLKLQVHNAGPGQFRVLELTRATLGSVGLYSRSAGGRWSWREAGTQTASPRGDIEAPGYAFRLWLPPGNSEHLIRLASSYPLNTAVLLSSENATLRQAQNSAGWYGWAMGMLGGMALALLLLRPRHVSLRLAMAFVIIQGAMALFALADRGVLGLWWMALPGVQHGLQLLGGLLLQMSHVWFMLLFLHERKALGEGWHNALMALLGVQATLLMLGIVITRPEVHVVLAVLPIASGLLLTLASLHAIRQGIAGARPLLVSSLALLLTYLLLATGLMSALPLLTAPYQWLLGLHIVQGALLLHAMRCGAPAAATASAADTTGAPADPVSTPPRAARPAAAMAAGASLRLPLRVLVVEDNDWVRQVIVGLLSKQGVETITAGTGMEALALLERETLDLVLMDCDLPELDGLSATQVWRQRERDLGRMPLPILAVTAHVSEFQRQQALEAGMNDFLAKPVDMRTLRETMIQWTSQARPDQATDRGPGEDT